MRSLQYGAALGALTITASATPNPYSWKPKPKPRDVWRPAVNSEALQAAVTEEALLAHEVQLQDFAYSYPERNRVMGGQAHNDTVTYIYEKLSALDYYDVTLQPWSAVVQTSGNASLSVDGSPVKASLMEYSSSGNVTAPLVVVSNLGCNQSDYPAEVEGNIALISRGECEFGLKSVYAGLAGALGAVEYNNIAGDLSGTLGTPREEGPYVPTVGVSQEIGTAWVDSIAAGETITATLYVNTVITDTTTYNVLAQTKGGDPNNTLIIGAHSDSVTAGPGINDNGSGTSATLEVAIQLSNYSLTNSVRFGFWSGEEEGLLGSTYYVEQLPAAELAKLRLNLNFDMLASHNFVYAIYDGDGDTFNTTGPAGSAEAEHLFQAYFESRGLNHTATAFDGRSDYGPFLEAGIASGGIDTGAEGIKTPEQAEQFGGTAGISYDVYYHSEFDTLDKLNVTAFTVSAQAVAHAVATYADSFASLGQEAAVARRGVQWHAPVLGGAGAAGVKPMRKRDAFRSKKLGIAYL